MDLDREAVSKTFIVESTEEIDLIEQALVALESQPTDEERLLSIFRAIHTIKGNAYSLGFRSLGDFAHAYEDLLTGWRNGKLPIGPGIITLLLRRADVLRHMLAAAGAGVERILPEHSVLLGCLERGVPVSMGSLTVVAPGAIPPRAPGRRRADLQAFADRERTLRVDTARLDRMLDLTGEIATARGRLRQAMDTLGRQTVNEALEDVERLFTDLQDLVMKLRMVPVGPVFRQHVRMARDLAVAQGKQVRLAVKGEDVEVDVTIIEHLKDPLTHIVRNALDHGIETPDIRRAAGKDAAGSLSLQARHDAGGILIEVRDDGAGLDRERILQKARERGLAQAAARLSATEIDRLVFEPGLSTAGGVSVLSGRGIGMDVVRRNVEALRGSVGIHSRPGQGTVVSIRFPLTLAIIEGFGVGVAGETYIVPLSAVVECQDLPEASRAEGNARGVLNFRGSALPYVRLRERFGLRGQHTGRQQAVVVRRSEGLAGLVVDELHGESQTVIKPLGAFLHHIPGIAGSAILGSGRVALILDVEELLRSASIEPWESGPARPSASIS